MTESEARLAILIVAAVIIGSVLAIAGCIAMSTKWSRQEEREERRLMPCPRCGVPPQLGYACGEYFISGDDPNCSYCGTAFSEMHSDPRMEIDAWNRRVDDGSLHIHGQGSADR